MVISHFQCVLAFLVLAHSQERIVSVLLCEIAHVRI